MRNGRPCAAIAPTLAALTLLNTPAVWADRLVDPSEGLPDGSFSAHVEGGGGEQSTQLGGQRVRLGVLDARGTASGWVYAGFGADASVAGQRQWNLDGPQVYGQRLGSFKLHWAGRPGDVNLAAHLGLSGGDKSAGVIASAAVGYWVVAGFKPCFDVYIYDNFNSASDPDRVHYELGGTPGLHFRSGHLSVRSSVSAI